LQVDPADKGGVWLSVVGTPREHGDNHRTTTKLSVSEVANVVIALRAYLNKYFMDISRDIRKTEAKGVLKTEQTTVAKTEESDEPTIYTVETVKALFPKDLEELLTFEQKDTYVQIKPQTYLGSENFAKIASIVRDAGGEYISAGKESHFRL